MTRNEVYMDNAFTSKNWMASRSNVPPLVLIKGAGDIASGIAHRLFRCGFRIVMTELTEPTVIRRPVSFAEAVYSGEHCVEGVRGVRCDSPVEAVRGTVDFIPVIVDPTAAIGKTLCPDAVVDAILAKRNTGTRLDDSTIVIGVGPGFTAGVDVHAVVETDRGHDLGRVIDVGSARADTGHPGEIGGHTTQRLLRSPCKGVFVATVAIGDMVQAGDCVGQVDGHPVVTSLAGVVRGILHDGLTVFQGMKIGDVDPRGERDYCFTISDKARAVGGGVLEALMTRWSSYRVG